MKCFKVVLLVLTLFIFSTHLSLRAEANQIPKVIADIHKEIFEENNLDVAEKMINEYQTNKNVNTKDELEFYSIIISQLKGESSKAKQKIISLINNKSLIEKEDIFERIDSIGDIFLNKFAFDEALKIFTLSFDIQNGSNVKSKNNLAYLSKTIGEIYLILDKIPQSDKYLKNALFYGDNIFDEQDHVEIGLSFADLEYKKGNFKVAKKKYKKLLAERDIDEINKEDVLNGLSQANFKLKDYSESIRILTNLIKQKEEKLKKYNLEVVKVELALYYAKIAQVFNAMKNYPQMKYYIDKARDICNGVSVSHEKYYIIELKKIESIILSLENSSMPVK